MALDVFGFVCMVSECLYVGMCVDDVSLPVERI